MKSLGGGERGGKGFGCGEVDVGDIDECAGAGELLTVASPMPLAPPVTRAWRLSRRKGAWSADEELIRARSLLSSRSALLQG